MSAPLANFFARSRAAVERARPYSASGRVTALVGSAMRVAGLEAPVGALVNVADGSAHGLAAEVVGFDDSQCLLLPLAAPEGLRAGARVQLSVEHARPLSGPGCLGRVIDGLGRPVDGGPALPRAAFSRRAQITSPLRRRRIEQPLDLGIRALNALLTVGVGSRLGLFAGSGVGKSTLLGQIAQGCNADCIVIGLIGERGREVREFIERDLGAALSRSVIVAATSDETPALRRRAAWLATELAQSLRDAGRQVLLLVDSLSRFAAAQREIGLAAGEPPATRGFPPSVWSALPQLLERAGNGEGAGSITGIYTVLVEADDPEDPIADACRSFLDGHIVLSRRLAERSQFPAIDLLASISRVMPDVMHADGLALAMRARAALAREADVEDLVSVGAYRPGSDPRIDQALKLAPRIRAFMSQPRGEHASLHESLAALRTALETESA